MSDINISVPGLPFLNLASTDTIALLRARNSSGLTQGENIVADGNAAVGDNGGGLYAWDALSVLDDDGVSTIKPTDRGALEAGRWRIIAGAPPVVTGFVRTDDLAATTDGDGAALVGFKQTGSGATNRTALAKMREVLSVLDFGAVGDGVTDDTVAITAAIVAARAQAKALYIPGSSEPYILSTPITISHDENLRGLRIFGDSAGSYYGDGRAVIKYTGGTDYAIKIIGAATGAGQPMFVDIDGVGFEGNAGADGCILVQRAWMCSFIRCQFVNFTKATAAGITFKADGAGTPFAGASTIEHCHFEQTGINVLFTGITGGQINMVRILNCTSLDQQYGVKSDWGAELPFTDHILIENCHWEGTLKTEIHSQAVANSWRILNNYFEALTRAGTIAATTFTPTIRFGSGGNVQCTIRGNTFRMPLTADQCYVSAIDISGFVAEENFSADGGSIDRWAVDLVTAVASRAEPFNYLATGLAPYPVRMNNFPIHTGLVNDNWSRVPAAGAGEFIGVSSGDGYPGGTVATLVAEYSKDNAKVDIRFKATITTKSAGGTDFIIGVLPHANYGPDMIFPVVVNTAGTWVVYWARLLSGGNTAIIYSAVGAAINYQTAISVGSIVTAQFSYPTRV